MADKRMYSKKITDSDAFIEMASSTQALYFHLNQGADDEGFNNQIQNAMFKAHASLDDLKVLLTKNFIIRFESGVVVIKHWWIHNTLRKDRFTPTSFQEELKLLGLKDNNSYTLSGEETVRLPNGCQMVAKRLPNGCQTVATDKSSIDKNSLDKSSIIKESEEKRVGGQKVDICPPYEEKSFDTTLFNVFIGKYGIGIDNYSAMVKSLDFGLLDKAFSQSKFLQENFTSLSKICREYQKIISGYFKDYTKPKEQTFEQRDYTKKDIESVFNDDQLL